MITIIAERVHHDGGIRVALKFPYDQEVIDLVRKLPDVRWSSRMQCWHISDLNQQTAIGQDLLKHTNITQSSAGRVRKIWRDTAVGSSLTGILQRLSGLTPR